VRIHAVRLRVGELSGVAPEALSFAFTVANEGSPIAGASLRVEQTEGRRSRPGGNLVCPASYDLGEQLRVILLWKSWKSRPERDRGFGRGLMRSSALAVTAS